MRSICRLKKRYRNVELQYLTLGLSHNFLEKEDDFMPFSVIKILGIIRKFKYAKLIVPLNKMHELE